MDAIIFLAPLSAFDQVLAEDENVNRLVSDISSLNRMIALMLKQCHAGGFCLTLESDDI